MWPFSKPAPRTVVHLRSMETPAVHWDATVLYDAWGSPYVNEWDGFSTASCGEIALHKDGGTSDTFVFGTEWRHKSGPPVRFPSGKPSRPFAKSERTGA